MFVLRFCMSVVIEAFLTMLIRTNYAWIFYEQNDNDELVENGFE